MSVGRYAFTENDHTFWIHLYIGAEVMANGCQVKITSEFPWNGQVRLQVCKDMEKEYSFGFRIPGWCEEYDISVDGDVRREEKSGYLYLTKKWKEKDVICLNFPMHVAGMVANELVREDIGKMAVKRGPFVYCLEEKDNGKNLHLLKIKTPLKVKEEAFAYGDKFMKIKISGSRQKLCGKKALYRKYEAEKCEEVTLNYIPYFAWGNRGEREMQVWIRY